MWVPYGAQFDHVVTSATRSAFRLEVRDRYNEPSETEPLQRFLADEPIDWAWHEPWLQFIADATARSCTFQRVRVVSRPPTDYTRFGRFLATRNVAAGEDIRYLDRQAAKRLALPNHDFWLLDDQRVAIMRFGDNDTLLGADVLDDPEVISQHIQWRDIAVTAATPHTQTIST